MEDDEATVDPEEVRAPYDPMPHGPAEVGVGPWVGPLPTGPEFDPHLLANGVRQYGVIDTEAGLARALERLAHVSPAPQALVPPFEYWRLFEPSHRAVTRSACFTS